MSQTDLETRLDSELRPLARRQVYEIEALMAQLAAERQARQLLQQNYNVLQAMLFGKKSERYVAPEAGEGLFNDAEALAKAPEASAEADLAQEPAAPRKRSGGRKPLPEHLARIEIRHELPEGARQCPCGAGEMAAIGEEVTEQLHIIPARFEVLRHLRCKYACKACQSNIVTAPMPAQPIPKSQASPSLLAHVAVNKYA